MSSSTPHLALCGLAGLLFVSCSGKQPAPAPPPAEGPAALLAGVGRGAASTRAALGARRMLAAASESRFALRPSSEPDGVLHAHNDGHGLLARFESDRVSLRKRGPDLQAATVVVGVQCSSGLTPVAPATPRPSARTANLLAYGRRAGPIAFEEWWANGPAGFEQGFQFAVPPCGDEGAVEIVVEWDGLEVGSHSSTGVELTDAAGTPVLRYDDLGAFDALGEALPSEMVVRDDHHVGLRVDLTRARFPVTVDPMVASIETTLQHRFPALSGDGYGGRTDISGDTAVVGSQWVWRNGKRTGAAYVFVRSGDGWVQQQRLDVPEDAQEGNRFGADVAIDGDTIVVSDDYGQGSAHVFVRNGETWSHQAKLVISEATYTGLAVAISGDTVAVSGGYRKVGLFTRSGDTWNEQQVLQGETGYEGDAYGRALSLDGDTLVVAAEQHAEDELDFDGAVYVYTRSGDTWSQQQKLTASDAGGADLFGSAVAVEGDTLLVGARFKTTTAGRSSGQAYVFQRSSGTWSETQQLQASDAGEGAGFGSSLDLNGDKALIGGGQATISGVSGHGAAYVFGWSGSSWVEEKQLLPSTLGDERTFFGWTVSLDGQTALVTALSDFLGDQPTSNPVYAFEGASWEQQADTLSAEADGASDRFGRPIAFAGNVAAIGAASALAELGADLFIFEHDGQAWSTTPAELGNAAGHTLGGLHIQDGFVFASRNPSGGPGYVEVIRKQDGQWTHVQTLQAPTPHDQDVFGWSLYGTRPMGGEDGVLAISSRDGDGDPQVHLFRLDSGSWTFAQSIAGPAEADAFFGGCVDATEDLVVVTSRAGGDDGGGAAYVYRRSGNSWSFEERLTPSDGEAFDDFGGSLAVDGDTVVIGSTFDQHPNDPNARGSAYVFAHGPDGWYEQAKLFPTSSSPVEGAFGQGVAIDGETALLGTRHSTDTDEIVAYVFVRSGESWTEETTLEAPGWESYASGHSPFLQGRLVVVGSPGTHVGANETQGVAHTFRLMGVAGQPCTNNDQCATPYTCVDGVCCTTACGSACAVCSEARGAVRDGLCSPAPDGRAGEPSCAGSLLCDGQRLDCPTGCSSDADCSNGRYCSHLGSCLLPKAQGVACNRAEECAEPGDCALCASGHCVDGVCCDNACDEACDTCVATAGASANGTCGLRRENAAGQPGCPGALVCDGSSALCPTSCVVDADCLPGHYCDGGDCVARQGLGIACSSDAECATNLTCTDGVCCGSACNAACDVCAASLGADADGVCTVVTEGTPGAPACQGGFLCDGEIAGCPTSCDLDADCEAGHFCSASGTCVTARPLGASCDPASDCRSEGCDICQSGWCVDGVCCDAACDGPCDVCATREGASVEGQCQLRRRGTEAVPACADGLLCDGESAQCPGGCAGLQECAAGYYCTPRGTCEPAQAAGSSCGADSDCGANLHCVDGVCCTSLCEEQCEACDVEGAEGTCTAVTGAPHGGRPACGGSDGDCLGTCNGQKRDGCAFPDHTRACGEQACLNAVFRPRVCNGAGDCVEGTTERCAPYGCNEGQTDCAESCDADRDCSAGAVCDTAKGQCAFAEGECLDLVTLEYADGSRESCAPYLCRGSECLRDCQSDDECLQGFTCEASTCVSAPGAHGDAGAASADDSGGGCSVRGGRSKPPATDLAVLGLFALALGIRRRRRSFRDCLGSETSPTLAPSPPKP